MRYLLQRTKRSAYENDNMTIFLSGCVMLVKQYKKMGHIKTYVSALFMYIALLHSK